MEPKNLLFICSDEHSRDIMGAAGHPMVQTPGLDALAARGTTFDAAYCNCPICVPSRANLMTGRHCNDVGFWDNCDPYDGSVPGWGHRLKDAGHHTVSIGKLHFRSADDDNGFVEEVIPLHVHGGIGDTYGLIRENMTPRPACKNLSAEAGEGDSSYTAYDREIADTAATWLKEQAPKYADKPWALFVSFVCPHFPLIAPSEYYEMYPEDQVPWPMLYDKADRPHFPWIDAMQVAFDYDKYFDEGSVRRAVAAYFGLVSFMSDQVGAVVAALDQAGLADDTRIVYTSDHGDAVGKRGLWAKSTMYEESAAVPMIIAGPGIPAGKRVRTPVSWVDLHPTIIENAGLKPHADDGDLPGTSLFDIIDGQDADRAIFSEYHAGGSPSGAFVIRQGRFKLHYYVGSDPLLYDLQEDPHETRDLSEEPAYAGILGKLRAELLEVCDPEETDRRAKTRQAELIERYGGREAILKQGCFGYSPTPGNEPVVDAAE